MLVLFVMDLNNFIDNNDIVLVGVSGGADSMCLLTMLAKFKEKNFKFYAIHVNHSIRGKEAERDEQTVKNYCKKLGVPLIQKKVDAINYSKENGKTLEEGARLLRYKVFGEVKEEIGATKIFVAHNKGDQAETILMHIARGSSIAGAAGMSEKGPLVQRPLLSVSREEILKYNKENNVPYEVDSTNLNSDYVRNHIRNNVMRELKKAYPNIENTLCEFGKICSRDEKYIESTIPKGLTKKVKGEVQISDKVCLLSEALSLRVIKSAVSSLGVNADVLKVHFENILGLFNKKNGSSLNLPHGLVAFKEYDHIVLTFKKEEDKVERAAFKLGKIVLSKVCIEVKRCEKPTTFLEGVNYIDLAKLPADACFRARAEGDVFQKKGARGKKSFADYLTDKKFPKRKRGELIVLASGNEVLAALTLDTGEKLKVDSNTNDVACIKVIDKL